MILTLNYGYFKANRRCKCMLLVYPDNFNKLPAIAYYTLTDKGSMSYDNTVVTNDTTVQIDIYADYPQTCLNCRRGYINY